MSSTILRNIEDDQIDNALLAIMLELVQEPEDIPKPR